MLENYRIGLRISLVIGAILSALLLMVGVGYWRLQELSTATQTMGSIESEKMKLAQEWHHAIELNWVRTEAILRDANPAAASVWKPEIDQTSARIDVLQKRLVELVHSDEGRALLANIDAKRSAYRTPRAEMLKKRAAGEGVQ
jgi:hypothetical protein